MQPREIAEKVLKKPVQSDSNEFLKFCRALNIIKRLKRERDPIQRGKLLNTLHSLQENGYITRAQCYEMERFL